MRKAASSGFSVLLLLLALVFSNYRVAHAYFDPGTGSLIIQALLGGLFASFFMLKVFWARVSRFVSRAVLRRVPTDFASDDDD